MLSVGILLSELSHEADVGLLDRVWPFFLAVVGAMLVAAAVLALRGGKGGEDDAADDE